MWRIGSRRLASTVAKGSAPQGLNLAGTWRLQSLVTSSASPLEYGVKLDASIGTIRSLSTSPPPASPLDAFRDPVDRQTRSAEKVGRSWSAKELRRKSYEDLHKLWYVLYMERNMLLTERQLSRRRQLLFPQPDRLKKVQKSMGAIRLVLAERKKKKIAEVHASKLEQALEDEGNEMEDFDVDEESTEEETK